MASWTPNVKVLSGTIGGTLSALAVRVVEHRLGISFTPEELYLMMLGGWFVCAYLIPEPVRSDILEMMGKP